MDAHVTWEPEEWKQLLDLRCLKSHYLEKLVDVHMEVSINGDTPKLMVYKGKSHLEMDDLGIPLF